MKALELLYDFFIFGFQNLINLRGFFRVLHTFHMFLLHILYAFILYCNYQLLSKWQRLVDLGIDDSLTIQGCCRLTLLSCRTRHYYFVLRSCFVKGIKLLRIDCLYFSVTGIRICYFHCFSRTGCNLVFLGFLFHIDNELLSIASLHNLP